MRKLIICIFLFSTLVLTVGIYVLYDLPTRESLAVATQNYANVKATLQAKTRLQKQKNTHFESLQYQVDSVELDARRQFRLIKADEKIAIIEYTHQPEIDPLNSYIPYAQESSSP
ncbi:MAG: hypothetical protein ACFCU1_05940 [Sumerlaeia bacterium]